MNEVHTQTVPGGGPEPGELLYTLGPDWKRIGLESLIRLAVSAFALGLAAYRGTEPALLLPTAAAALPESNSKRSDNVSVHDPSIFRDPKDGAYYAFGTHFAVASSYDLIEWTQEASDNAFQVLYGDEKVTISGVDWPKALEDTVRLVKPVATGSNAIQTTWAPDVEYLNGKYYMYYSITGGFGSSASAIGRVEADNVLGPYSNNKILLQSVSADEMNFVSEAAGGKPNCIDSELFFDKDGKLWMVYGSHFGGIYIKELYNEGDNIGLPKEEGAGKLLWKG